MQAAATVLAAVVVLAVYTHGQDGNISPRATTCPWPCPEYYQPVCGSNGKTYSNPCFLYEAAACENKCITQRHEGVCVSPCPEVCPTVVQPVCGSDGRTYSSACHLDLERCTNPCVELAHDGVCESQGAGCRQMCVGMDPVCGSDGVTYMSECHLANAACDNPCIKKVADGQCTRNCGDICPVHVADASVCGSDGTTYESPCHLQEAACRNPCLTMQHDGPCDRQPCPTICPLNFAPVCGSDGKTYSNQCMLDAAACQNPCITIKSQGPCPRNCGDPCPMLAQDMPVCGSDGTTYPTLCHLEDAACQDPCIVLQREGPCLTTGCPRFCPLHFDPVCGSDGKTYGNACQLSAASICENPCIGQRHAGPCLRNCGDPCPTQGQLPVCGSDNITYPSKCHLEEAACQNACLAFQHEGTCGTTQPCPQFCSFEIDPVCGSDGKMYSNKCQLDMAACLNPCITLRAQGLCSRACGDPCPLTTIKMPVCGSDGVTYLSQCHLEEAMCQNPCLALQHAGPCAETECCLDGTLTLPDLNVQLSCQGGALLAEPLTGLTTTTPTVTATPTQGHDCLFAGRGYPVGARLDHLCFPMQCTTYGWAFTGEISDCCRHCHLHGDLHVFTFDHQQYDFNGTCNYTVAQQGSSYDPPLGVFTWPKTCKGRSTCFRHTTFRNDEHTIVTINHYDLYKVNVNGHEIQVPESGVHVLTTGSGAAVPVLAWRGACGIYLAGSSGIVLLACRLRLDVWATSSLVGQLDGLCGYYNLDSYDDFRTREGVIHPPHNWPLAFPHSWRTNMQTEAQCMHPYTGPVNGDNPCTVVDPKWISLYETTCAKKLGTAGNQPSTQLSFVPPVYTIKPYIRMCAVDLCVMHQGGVPVKAIEQWLLLLSQNFALSLGLWQRVTGPGGSGGQTQIDPTTVLPHCTSTTTPDQCTTTSATTTTVTASLLKTTTLFSTTTTTSTTSVTSTTTTSITSTTTTTTSITTTTTLFITTSPTYPEVPSTSEYTFPDFTFPTDFYKPTTSYVTPHTQTQTFPVYSNPPTTYPHITDTTSYIPAFPYTYTPPSYPTYPWETTHTQTTFTFTTDTPTYTFSIPTYTPTETFPTYPFPTYAPYTPTTTRPAETSTYTFSTPPSCVQKDCPSRCVPAGKCPQGTMELPWPYLCEGDCVCCI